MMVRFELPTCLHLLLIMVGTILLPTLAADGDNSHLLTLVHYGENYIPTLAADGKSHLPPPAAGGKSHLPPLAVDGKSHPTSC